MAGTRSDPSATAITGTVDPAEVAQLRARGEEIAARFGLELTDTTTIAGRCDEAAEYFDFLAAAYPRRQANATDIDTGTTDDDDPAPF